MVAGILLASASPADAEAGRAAVIVHPPALQASAEAWAAYRRGQDWDIRLLAVESGESPDALRTRIHAFFNDRPMTSEIRAVLLLGDAPSAVAGPADSPGAHRADPDGIPAFFFPQDEPALLRGGEPTFPSDHPYALPDRPSERERLTSSIAVGRVPVATNEEALAVLDKIKRYESLPAEGTWRRRITYVAGEGRFGPFDRLLESLFIRFADELLPPSFDLTMTYAKPGSPWCPPPSQVERTTLLRLTEGSLLFTYLGHGHAQGLDSMRVGDQRFPILRASALDELPPNDRLPIALLACCSTGWFDLPPKNGRERKSLAESMLLAANGPIAVVAGTRPTHPYGNAVMQKELTRVLLAHGDQPLGEIDRLTRIEMMRLDDDDRTLDAIVRPVAIATDWKLSLADLRRMHVRMYVLVGDPMLRVIDQGENLASVELLNHGRDMGLALAVDDGWIRSAEIVGETARSAQPQHPSAPPLTELPEPFAPLEEIERDARARFPLANMRGRLSLTTSPVDHPLIADMIESRSRLANAAHPVPWIRDLPRSPRFSRPGEWTILLPARSLEGVGLIRVRIEGQRFDGSRFEAFGGVRVERPRSTAP
jgi:hypothetical protein